MPTIIEHGRTTTVEDVRTFMRTRTMCGVGRDGDSYFVYMRAKGEPYTKHCGPYSTRDQAVDWINAVRET